MTSLALVPMPQRQSPCPNCRGVELVCPVCDKDWYFDTDYAEINWHFIPEDRTLLSYYTYGDISVTADKLHSSSQSSMEGTLFLGAHGRFSDTVFKVLTRSLLADQIELIFHCTNSKAHNVLGVRCLTCNYACSIAFSKHNQEAYPRLRGSLARWLGVEEDDVAGSGCYVVAMKNILSATVHNHVKAPASVK